jgi:hypothetical protein
MSNEATQSEKRAIVKNDSYFSRQQNTPDDAGGRYSRITPSQLTGQSPSPVPTLPATSSFAQGIDQVVGPEPPLGFSVNTMEVTGIPAEVEKSIVGGTATTPLAVPNLEGPAPNPTTTVGSPCAVSLVDRAGLSSFSSQDGADPLSSAELASAAIEPERSASSTPTKWRRR